MTTQTVQAAPAAPRPALSASLVALLNALSRGAARDEYIVLREHGGDQNRRTHGLSVLDAARGFVPPLVLTVLETSASPWSIDMVRRRNSEIGEATSASVLCLTKTFEREFVQKYFKGVLLPAAGVWTWPVGEIVRWEESLSAALPPVMILRALPQVVAVFALRAPLPYASEGDRAAVRDLLSKLAGAADADVPAEDLSVPLIGTATKNFSPAVCSATYANPGNVHDVADVWSAISREDAGK